MKRLIILPIFLLFIFSSCVNQNKKCDIFEFEKRINSLYNDKVFNTENLITDKINTIYWCCDKNTCVAFYVNNKTGNIEKCNVSTDSKKINKSFINNIRRALTFNNEYICESEFETEKFYMISFEDRRYIKENKEPLLKKEIKEEDLY